jgi:hypothetical protein
MDEVNFYESGFLCPDASACFTPSALGNSEFLEGTLKKTSFIAVRKILGYRFFWGFPKRYLE